MAALKDVLMRCPLFASMTPDEAAALVTDRGECQQVAKGAYVSDYGQHLGIVLSGKLEVRGNDGTPLNQLSSGSMFGVANLFSTHPKPPTKIIAKQKSEVLLLDETTLETLFSADARVMRNYLRFLTDRIWFLNWKIQLFSADSAEKKLLIFLNNLPPDEEGNLQIPPLSQLAEILSMGRASLYRATSSLESAGLLERISSHCWKLTQPTIE